MLAPKRKEIEKEVRRIYDRDEGEGEACPCVAILLALCALGSPEAARTGASCSAEGNKFSLATRATPDLPRSRLALPLPSPALAARWLPA